MSKEKKPRMYERNSGVNDKRMEILRTILATIVLTGAGLGIMFLNFHLPIISKMFTVELSVFFPLLGAVAYGPLVGFLVCLFKYALYAVIVPSAAVSSVANFLIETVFVVITGIYYIKSISPDNGIIQEEITVQYRRRKLITGSIIGILPALIVQFYVTNYFTFPMFNRLYKSYGYSNKNILQSYDISLNTIRERVPEKLSGLVPTVSELWQGILVINLPITFIKLLLVSLLLAYIYPMISPFMHFGSKNA